MCWVGNIEENASIEVKFTGAIVLAEILTLVNGNIEDFARFWRLLVNVGLKIVNEKENGAFINAMGTERMNWTKFMGYLIIAGYMFHCRPESDPKLVALFKKLEQFPDKCDRINVLGKNVCDSLNVDRYGARSSVVFPDVARLFMVCAIFFICIVEAATDVKDRFLWSLVAVLSSGLCFDAAFTSRVDFSAANMFSPALYFDKNLLPQIISTKIELAFVEKDLEKKVEVATLCPEESAILDEMQVLEQPVVKNNSNAVVIPQSNMEKRVAKPIGDEVKIGSEIVVAQVSCPSTVELPNPLESSKNAVPATLTEVDADFQVVTSKRSKKRTEAKGARTQIKK